MKFGVQLPEVERTVRWPELAAMARLIEDSGFDSIWVGDHLLYRSPERGDHGPWEAWSQMAAVAAITSRVEIGPLVASTSFHAPAMLAKKAATINEISSGRFILGLGAGWNRVEYDAFGFPFDRRASRFEEAFAIIRRLLDGESFSFDGEFYQVDQSSILPLFGDVPLLIGSEGPRMLSITAPYMGMWNAWHAWYGNRAAGLPPLLDKVDTALETAGRNPADVEKTTAVLMGFSEGTGRQQVDDSHVAEALTGTPQQLAEALRGWEDAGISHVQLVLDPITLESIEQAAEVVAAYRM